MGICKSFVLFVLFFNKKSFNLFLGVVFNVFFPTIFVKMLKFVWKNLENVVFIL